MTDRIGVRYELLKKVESIDLPQGSRVRDLLEALSLYPDAYIVLIGRRPVPITEELKDGAELRIIKVASGG